MTLENIGRPNQSMLLQILTLYRNSLIQVDCEICYLEKDKMTRDITHYDQLGTKYSFT